MSHTPGDQEPHCFADTQPTEVSLLPARDAQVLAQACVLVALKPCAVER